MNGILNSNFLNTFSKNNKANEGIQISIALVSVEIVPINKSRNMIILQNNGTEPCLIRLNDNASSTNYNFILKGASAVDKGDGGVLELKNFNGDIHGICLANSTKITVLELINL